MKFKSLITMFLLGVVLLSFIPQLVLSETLVKTDFLLESWAKTIDYFDYARAYATLHGIDTPAGFQNWHANLYMTYINTTGLHLLYAGLEDITFGGPSRFRIPMQAFIMHYKTDNRTRDVIMASTFLMLLAFNETADSIHDESPDMNDTLWASFSMGFDLSGLNATLPVLNSQTEAIPLEHSDNKLEWTWGMKYTNLTAFWWRTWINPLNPHFESGWPIAITVYDELTFTYNLTISPTTKTATLTENHVIGRMRELLLFQGLLWIHYNSTGTYWHNSKVSNDTIYDFIQDNQIKMSIVNFQTSILADRETYSMTPTGQNVAETEATLSAASVTTYADDGEKISKTDFSTKKTYNLHNYTADPSENDFDTNNATARTAKIAGFAGNAGLFAYHIGLMKFLPLTVVHMYPGMYLRARERITNMSRANYFYIIAYPTYSGYRVEHDPTFTFYLTTTAQDDAGKGLNLGGIIVIGAVVAVIVIAAVVLIRRRKPIPPPPPQ